VRTDTHDRASSGATRTAVRLGSGAVLILLIEFLDELVFGTRETAWPLIRDDLGLSYVEIGLLLTVPAVAANLVEPPIFLLGDVWNRRALVLGGGVAFALGLALAAASGGLAALLAAFVVFSPASGAFVNLAQASLMDDAPEDRERNMARWALAGSAANAAAPFCVGALLAMGAGWRSLFFALSVASVGLVAAVRRVEFRTPMRHDDGPASPAAALRLARAALGRREPWRWLVLLECANLMMDTLHGFLALYFVDVVGATPARAAVAVAVWTVCGLPGDALLIPLLARVDGVRYLRASAALMLALFPAFLLAESPAAKLALLGALGFFNAGWYSILKARLYGAMPEASGTVAALCSIANLAGCLVPVALGAAAEAIGLGHVMWLLLVGPIALLVGLPRRSP
jgi:FSR family fosmidomycin resistance protein-like MFS transporter